MQETAPAHKTSLGSSPRRLLSIAPDTSRGRARRPRGEVYCRALACGVCTQLWASAGARQKIQRARIERGLGRPSALHCVPSRTESRGAVWIEMRPWPRCRRRCRLCLGTPAREKLAIVSFVFPAPARLRSGSFLCRDDARHHLRLPRLGPAIEACFGQHFSISWSNTETIRRCRWQAAIRRASPNGVGSANAVHRSGIEDVTL